MLAAERLPRFGQQGLGKGVADAEAGLDGQGPGTRLSRRLGIPLYLAAVQTFAETAVAVLRHFADTPRALNEHQQLPGTTRTPRLCSAMCLAPMRCFP